MFFQKGLFLSILLLLSTILKYLINMCVNMYQSVQISINILSMFVNVLSICVLYDLGCGAWEWEGGGENIHVLIYNI